MTAATQPHEAQVQTWKRSETKTMRTVDEASPATTTETTEACETTRLQTRRGPSSDRPTPDASVATLNSLPDTDARFALGLASPAETCKSKVPIHPPPTLVSLPSMQQIASAATRHPPPSSTLLPVRARAATPDIPLPRFAPFPYSAMSCSSSPQVPAAALSSSPRHLGPPLSMSSDSARHLAGTEHGYLEMCTKKRKIAYTTHARRVGAVVLARAPLASVALWSQPGPVVLSVSSADQPSSSWPRLNNGFLAPSRPPRWYLFFFFFSSLSSPFIFFLTSDFFPSCFLTSLYSLPHPSNPLLVPGPVLTRLIVQLPHHTTFFLFSLSFAVLPSCFTTQQQQQQVRSLPHGARFEVRSCSGSGPTALSLRGPVQTFLFALVRVF